MEEQRNLVKLFKSTGYWADLQEVIIEIAIVRAYACAAGYGKEEQGLGRSKGGFTSKINALVDALGNPLKFIITGGNRNDIIKATLLKI